MSKKAYGFTIVELLIVIVVIGILAAISIVAYNSMSNKANDSAVQSDLKNIGQKFEMYKAEKGLWPVTLAEVQDTGIKATKNAYGHHVVVSDMEYNLLYCRHEDGLRNMAVVGRSKSGNIYAYADGTVTEYSGRWNATLNICNDAGVAIVNGTHRIWMYELDVWKPFL